MLLLNRDHYAPCSLERQDFAFTDRMRMCCIKPLANKVS